MHLPLIIFLGQRLKWRSPCVKIVVGVICLNLIKMHNSIICIKIKLNWEKKNWAQDIYILNFELLLQVLYIRSSITPPMRQIPTVFSPSIRKITITNEIIKTRTTRQRYTKNMWHFEACSMCPRNLCWQAKKRL